MILVETINTKAHVVKKRGRGRIWRIKMSSMPFPLLSSSETHRKRVYRWSHTGRKIRIYAGGVDEIRVSHSFITYIYSCSVNLSRPCVPFETHKIYCKPSTTTICHIQWCHNIVFTIPNDSSINPRDVFTRSFLWDKSLFMMEGNSRPATCTRPSFVLIWMVRLKKRHIPYETGQKRLKNKNYIIDVWMYLSIFFTI